MHLTGSDLRQEAEALDLQLCTPQERALTSRLFFLLLFIVVFMKTSEVSISFQIENKNISEIMKSSVRWADTRSHPELRTAFYLVIPCYISKTMKGDVRLKTNKQTNPTFHSWNHLRFIKKKSRLLTKICGRCHVRTTPLPCHTAKHSGVNKLFNKDKIGRLLPYSKLSG